MRDIPHSPVALHEAAHLFGTLIAETILASVPVRARKQAGHMGASDLIKALQNLARRGPSTYGESGINLLVFFTVRPNAINPVFVPPPIVFLQKHTEAFFW